MIGIAIQELQIHGLSNAQLGKRFAWNFGVNCGRLGFSYSNK